MTPLTFQAALRFVGAIKGALAATPAEQSSAHQGLVETFNGHWKLICDGLPEVELAEFLALFPTELARAPSLGARLNPQAMFAQQEVASDARTRLGQLAGWLEGFVQAATFAERMRVEAEAQARENARIDRQYP